MLQIFLIAKGVRVFGLAHRLKFVYEFIRKKKRLLSCGFFFFNLYMYFYTSMIKKKLFL